MPVFNLVRIGEILIKVTIFSFILRVIVDFALDFRQILGELLNKMGLSLDSVNGVNLGCVGEKLGFTDFLNALMSTTYISMGVLISGTISILGFVYTIKIYRFAMRI